MNYCDRFETNPMHAVEREEWRDAMRHDTSPCYRHDYRPDLRTRGGGGVCVGCGDTISADEL